MWPQVGTEALMSTSSDPFPAERIKMRGVSRLLHIAAAELQNIFVERSIAKMPNSCSQPYSSLLLMSATEMQLQKVEVGHRQPSHSSSTTQSLLLIISVVSLFRFRFRFCVTTSILHSHSSTVLQYSFAAHSPILPDSLIDSHATDLLV